MTWFLEPLSHQWTQLEWQNTYLSDSAGVIKLCGETQFMWSLYHTVTFFEKALKRSGLSKINVNTINSTASPHPLASHLPWMLPPLLKIEILLGKTEKFDELMVAAEEERELANDKDQS